MTLSFVLHLWCYLFIAFAILSYPILKRIIDKITQDSNGINWKISVIISYIIFFFLTPIALFIIIIFWLIVINGFIKHKITLKEQLDDFMEFAEKNLRKEGKI